MYGGSIEADPWTTGNVAMQQYNRRDVNHVRINVSDLEHAMGFYTGIPGFTVAGRREPDKAWLNFGQYPEDEKLWFHNLEPDAAPGATPVDHRRP